MTITTNEVHLIGTFLISVRLKIESFCVPLGIHFFKTLIEIAWMLTTSPMIKPKSYLKVVILVYQRDIGQIIYSSNPQPPS